VNIGYYFIPANLFKILQFHVRIEFSNNRGQLIPLLYLYLEVRLLANMAFEFRLIVGRGLFGLGEFLVEVLADHQTLSFCILLIMMIKSPIFK
jgi:hypothetical protein